MPALETALASHACILRIAFSIASQCRVLDRLPDASAKNALQITSQMSSRSLAVDVFQILGETMRNCELSTNPAWSVLALVLARILVLVLVVVLVLVQVLIL